MTKSKVLILSIVGIVYASVFFGTVIKVPSDDNNIIPDVNPEYLVYINTDGYESLQLAIDNAKNNDTIDIRGDIVESINIANKTITINGNNHTITSPMFTNTLINTTKAIITIDEGTINIRNLKIDGQEKIDANYANIGIYAVSSSVSLENVIINNINHQADQLDKYPYGTGIYIVNDSDVLKDVKLTNVRINNFHQTGIYVNNRTEKEMNVTIDQCTIKGLGQTRDICQRGIVLLGSIKGDISNNTISDLRFLGMNEKGTALLIKNEMLNLVLTNNICVNVDIDKNQET